MNGQTAGRMSLRDDWSGLLVFCAGSSWNSTRGSDRHLIAALSRDRPVLWVDPPVSPLTPLRRTHAHDAFRGLHVIAPNVARVTPLSLPGVSRPGLRGVAVAVTRRAMRQAVRALAVDVDTVVVASLNGLLGVFDEPHRVLYATDDLAAAGQLIGLSPRWLRRQEEHMRRSATDVVCVSPAIANRWEATTAAKVHVIPNGCDVDAYADITNAPAPPDVFLPAPIAGFIGQLSERIDLAYLEAVAESGVSLLMVGPRQPTFDATKVEHLLRRPNVQWVGPKPFDQLPSYLNQVTIGLTPYSQSQFNAGSFPLKTLEYLAAGRRAVVTDLPASRWLDTELIAIRRSPEQFAEAVMEWISPEAASNNFAQCQSFARQHSWRKRADDFAAVLDGGLN